MGNRMKRQTSDQRLAELEALNTLAKGRAEVGHGKINQYIIPGKRTNEYSFVDDLISE